MVTAVPLTDKLRLVGEKFTWVLAGVPAVNCHHGMNCEIAISNNVEIPAAKAIKLILFFMFFTLACYVDVS